jgi:hypothetical protein
VLHCRGDEVVPFEEGRRLASLIAGSRFVPLDGRNHIPLRNEPAFIRLIDEIREFLGRRAVGPTIFPMSRTCSKCGRTYDDDSLNFCLDDGARLSVSSGDTMKAGSDDMEPTKVFP